MVKKISNLSHDRRLDNEDMYVSADQRSVNRGRRVAPRTEVCRPCLVWQPDAPRERWQGVMLDLNPYGMRIRMLDMFDVDTVLVAQMMRDDEFRLPLSPPIRVRVVRVADGGDGFIDHGVKVLLTKIRKPEEGARVRPEHPTVFRPRKPRMHTADLTRERGPRRPGRNRG